ncbi:MAG: (Fe-S)-binding protein [Candidatus Competibacteraceae bacterium]
MPVKTAALLRKAGFEVVLPEDNGSLCCGQPFESKGLPEQADAKRREVEQALLKASRNGQDPIVFDTTPCALRVRKIRHKPRSSCTTSPSSSTTWCWRG